MSGRPAWPRRTPVTRLVPLIATIFLIAGCASDGFARGVAAQPRTGPLVVAWINQGSASEDAWTASQRRAADRVASEFGRRVEVRFVENVDLGRSADRAVDRVVDQGADLVFATSLALEPALAAGASRHPGTRFEQVRGTARGANLGTFTGAYEETAYLTGMAAASASPSGRLGFVAQFPQPEMVRIIDGYTLGARSIRPDATVEVAWTGSWWDPAGEDAAASRLIAGGVDVIATTCTSLATGVSALRANVPWSGHDQDSSVAFADVWLTANITQWDRYYLRRVGDVLNGRWRSDGYYGDLRDGFLTLAPFGRRVDDAARGRIEVMRQRIADGSFDVFAGPLHDDVGRIRVPDGATLDVDQRLHMDWLIDGARTSVTSPPVAGVAAGGTR